jgi:ABC-type Na+ transport system ATPase subunit NatA
MSERRIGRGRTTRDHDVPQDDAALKVGAPKDHAVGTAATVSIARHAMRHLGVARTARTLAKINQPGGFDCPGCAWPEPAHGAHLEFCENGAKAVADEATTRRVTPEFFAQHSIAELRGQQDHWLNAQGRLTEPLHHAPGATHSPPITWDDAYAPTARELHALYSPDEPAFYDFLSGKETIDFVLNVRGVPLDTAWRGVNEIVERLELADSLDVAAGGYSHGTKKKLALLLALAHDPTLLLLDEPTNGLDPPTAARVRALLRERADAGAAVVVSTHLLDMADQLCDRVLVVHHGRLIAEGTPESVRAQAGVGAAASLEDAFLALVR